MTMTEKMRRCLIDLVKTGSSTNAANDVTLSALSRKGLVEYDSEQNAWYPTPKGIDVAAQGIPETRHRRGKPQSEKVREYMKENGRNKWLSANDVVKALDLPLGNVNSILRGDSLKLNDRNIICSEDWDIYIQGGLLGYRWVDNKSNIDPSSLPNFYPEEE